MGFLDALYPWRCAMCDRSSDRANRYVCSECLMRVPFVVQTGCCRVCGRAVEALNGEYLCESCAGARAPAYDRAASAVRLEGKTRKLLHAFKYRRALWLRNDFVDWLEAAANARYDLPAVDVVVPVPATPLHRLDRGYSPVDILAHALARRMDRRYVRSALRRCGDLHRQAGLDEETRFRNVVNTIAVRRPEAVNGRTVLVVDDVMTTGATLSETARMLRGAGAERVWCVTLARSLRD